MVPEGCRGATEAKKEMPNVRQLLNIGNREIIIFPVIGFQCAPHIFLRQWIVMLHTISRTTVYKYYDKIWQELFGILAQSDKQTIL